MKSRTLWRAEPPPWRTAEESSFSAQVSPAVTSKPAAALRRPASTPPAPPPLPPLPTPLLQPGAVGGARAPPGAAAGGELFSPPGAAGGKENAGGRNAPPRLPAGGDPALPRARAPLAPPGVVDLGDRGKVPAERADLPRLVRAQ